jgi:hypothetical protein
MLPRQMKVVTWVTRYLMRLFIHYHTMFRNQKRWRTFLVIITIVKLFCSIYFNSIFIVTIRDKPVFKQKVVNGLVKTVI